MMVHKYQKAFNIKMQEQQFINSVCRLFSAELVKMIYNITKGRYNTRIITN